MKKILFLLFVVITMPLMAQNTITHIVQSNETLQSIAKRYGVTVTEILKASPNTAKNMKSGKGLIVGQRLNIPSKKAAKNTSRSASSGKRKTKGDNSKANTNRKKDPVLPSKETSQKNNDVGKQAFSELNNENRVQKEIISSQDAIINTGYVKIETKKQLRKTGILSSGKKIVAGNLNPNGCQIVDIRQMTEITLYSKKPEVLSAMPSQSYIIQRNSDGKSCTLRILDVSLFWSISNYLVIAL